MAYTKDNSDYSFAIKGILHVIYKLRSVLEGI